MVNEAEVKDAFRKKYDYFTPEESNAIYEVALKTYLDIAFPFHPDIVTVPTSNPRGWTWVYECMGEIVEKNGCSSMTSYSENGLSISWDGSGVSKGLINRLTPKAGVL